LDGWQRDLRAPQEIPVYGPLMFHSERWDSVLVDILLLCVGVSVFWHMPFHISSWLAP